MSKDWSKREIENIVNKIVDDKINKATKKFSSENEIRKMIKNDIEDFYKKMKKEKNVMSDKETKEMIRTTMINLYKFMWEKSNFFIGNI
jgi:DNA helicase IV